MLIINATIRKNKGKSANRRMRIANRFPAIIYGGSEAPIAIELNQDSIFTTEKKKGFYKTVLHLVIDGKKSKVKIKEVQHHPFKLKFMHIDFIRV